MSTNINSDFSESVYVNRKCSKLFCQCNFHLPLELWLYYEKVFFIKFSSSDEKFTPAIESTVKLGNKELFGHLKIVP